MTNRPRQVQQRIAVIGAINRDVVIMPDGSRHTGWGGILFNVAALLKHGNRSLTIKPISYLGRDARRPVERWLSASRQIDSSGLIKHPRRGNECRMQYLDPETRIERLQYPVPALTFPHVRSALDADLVLVNYILGRDLRLSALEQLRREYAGPIYIDVHSYLLGRRRDGRRFARRPLPWRRVLACADFLQVNQTEFTTLSESEVTVTAIRNWAQRVLTPLRCQALMVTLGSKGAVCIYRRGRHWRALTVAAARRPASVDPTGAGDTFTGAWIVRWLATHDLRQATEFATRAAARPARPPI